MRVSRRAVAAYEKVVQNLVDLGPLLMMPAVVAGPSV
jgi:hypothetical protein